MKLYHHPLAPNPRRARIFLAEKGIEVPLVEIDIFSGANRTTEFLAKNPVGGLPVLELDDGTCIAESVAICRYFEEQKPEPRLMGVDQVDRALVEMWNRRMELLVFSNIGGAFQHTTDFFKARMTPIREYGERCKTAAFDRLAWMDKELASRTFVAGERYTIADITLLCGIDLGRMMANMPIPSELKNVQRW